MIVIVIVIEYLYSATYKQRRALGVLLYCGPFQLESRHRVPQSLRADISSLSFDQFRNSLKP